MANQAGRGLLPGGNSGDFGEPDKRPPGNGAVADEIAGSMNVLTQDPLVGSELGDYRIVSVLGRGGMGVVYKAEDDLGRAVALKVMAPELIRNPEFKERFIRESQSVIDHPNVIPIYEASQEDQLLYIAMKLVEGPDLKTLIQNEGRLLPARTVQICSQASAALDAAHESGMVHRDVKPQNILLEPAEEKGGPEHVYLTDFGLVKRVASQSSFTDSTYLIGSVQYMSPEQIEGRDVDGRSDVYALGCVLYECLTGSVPFDKETEVAVLFSHLNEAPQSVTRKVPVLGESVDQVIAKAMAKSPNDRYLTAGEFAAALQKELGISSGRVRSIWAPGVMGASGPRRRSPGTKVTGKPAAATASSKWRSWVATAAAAVMFIGAWVSPDEKGNLNSSPSAADVALAQPEPPGSEILAEDPELSVDKSDDQVTAASQPSSAGANASGVALGTQNRGGATDATQPVTEAAVEPRRIRTPVRTTAPEVHEDQGWVLFTRNVSGGGDIFMMRPDGTHLTNITESSVTDATPDLSPDGNKLAFFSDRYWGFDIYTMKLNGKSVYRLTPDDAYDLDPQWSPTRKEVVYEAHPNWNWNSATRQYELGTGYIRLANARGTKIRTLSVGTAPSWSPNGDRIVFSRDDDLFVIRRNGGTPTRLTNTTERESDPQWSPDGKKIVFVGDTPSDIFVINADGSNRVRLTNTTTHEDWSPVWSPNGNKLAWAARNQVEDTWDIWVMNADGTGAENLTKDAVKDYAPDWGTRQ